METRAKSRRDIAVQNRIQKIMEHANRYSFKGRSRLAADAGVARSTVTRLLDGKARPTFYVLWKITAALEKALGQKLDPRELVSLDGTYPTPSACALVGCRHCISEDAYADDNTLRPEYKTTNEISVGRQPADAKEVW